jgi:hypothetical protein
MERLSHCPVSYSARWDSNEIWIVRVRGIIRYLIPLTLLLAALIVRRAMPEMWLIEFLFAGYRLYFTVLAVTVLTVFGELCLVRRRGRHRPSPRPGEALRSWTATELYGKGWWAVWGLLALGVVILFFLSAFMAR